MVGLQNVLCLVAGCYPSSVAIWCGAATFPARNSISRGLRHAWQLAVAPFKPGVLVKVTTAMLSPHLHNISVCILQLGRGVGIHHPGVPDLGQ